MHWIKLCYLFLIIASFEGLSRNADERLRLLNILSRQAVYMPNCINFQNGIERIYRNKLSVVLVEAISCDVGQWRGH